MRFEIPEFKRCCCCLPLRYGILCLGYFNLLTTALFLVVETYLFNIDSDLSTTTMSAFRGVSFFAQSWLVILLFLMECAFSILLIVGAHLKRVRLLRIYSFYLLATTIASVLLLLLARMYSIVVSHTHWSFHMVELAFAFSGFVLHLYLLLLIHSEVKKLEASGSSSFVNHASEVTVTIPDRRGQNPF